MRKQKTGLVALTSLISLLAFAGSALAYGGATVSWTAPTLDQGGGALSGLTGYRVYYRSTTFNCTAWDAADQTARAANSGLLPTTPAFIDVPSTNGTTTTFTFSDTTLLTPGLTYYFSVVAYDASGNLSACATGSNGTTVNKVVSYSADIDVNSCVDYRDYGTFHTNYGNTTCGNSADFDHGNGTPGSGLCAVNYLDYGILHANYNQGTCSN